MFYVYNNYKTQTKRETFLFQQGIHSLSLTSWNQSKTRSRNLDPFEFMKLISQTLQPREGQMHLTRQGKSQINIASVQ